MQTPELVNLIVAVLGMLSCAAFVVYPLVATIRRQYHLRNVRLAIQTADRDLVRIINIEAIENEDPEKLKWIMQELS